MSAVQERWRGVLGRLHSWRDANPRRRAVYRTAVGVFGGAVTVLGLILVPYPGPGWLVVFAGLGILATEFAWAQRLLRYARARYAEWQAWLGRQSWPVRIAVLGALAALVVVILWLLGIFSLADRWFDLGLPWLHSPVLG